MSDNRQSFSDRNSWHFAVAKSFPAARAATKVLVEARIVDGAEIAEWDFLTNTGWMRSIVVPQAVPATDGHAGYLSETPVSGRLTRGMKVLDAAGKAIDEIDDVTDMKARGARVTTRAGYDFRVKPDGSNDKGWRFASADGKVLVEAPMGGAAWQAKTALDEASGADGGRFVVYSRDVKTAIAVVTSSKDVATAWAVDHFKSSAVVVIAASNTAELKAAGVDAKFFKASRTDTVITKAKAAALVSHRSADAATYTPPNLDIAVSTPFPAVIVLGEWTTQPGDVLNRNNTLRQEGVMVRNTVDKADGKVLGVETDVHDVWNEWIVVLTAGGKKVKWRGDAVNMPATGWSWPDAMGRQTAQKP